MRSDAKSPGKTASKKITSTKPFSIVAIGASAGGLEAITEILKNLPADIGMSFLYVQHFGAGNKSRLTEILSRSTKMKVQEINDLEKIEPNNLFVIPHNRALNVTGGKIKLIPLSKSKPAVTVDSLFTALAKTQKERVIGIVLSGTMSDGSLGIQAIKDAGGLTFAQDKTAKFASMPQSAIATDAVDFVLSPKKIALQLTQFSKQAHIKTKSAKANKEDLIDNNDPDLKVIFNLLAKVTGVDFSEYKMNTIKRRISRRMSLHKIRSLKGYAKHIGENKGELDFLYKDLLINVTSFFRDADTHQYLKTTLLPKLLKKKQAGEMLRIWVPACATGEEAYSIAMMLLEIQGNKSTTVPVQIFATDLSAQAISKARIGIYSKEELQGVSPKRIGRFFTLTNGGYRVNKTMRDMCIFATHNILRDPPFSHLDFISCCNLFIYLDVAAQKKAISTFHYALRDDGFLMLGRSENVSQSTNLFISVNKTFKIFSRKTSTDTRAMPPLQSRIGQQAFIGKNISATGINRTQTPIAIEVVENSLNKVIDKVLISEFMPASVVINHAMEIVQFRGATDLFLTHPKGKATFNILKMARPDIVFELRNAISKAIKTKQRVRKTGVEMETNGATRRISMEVIPLKIESSDPLLLILFTEQEQAEVSSEGTGKKSNSIAKDRKIKKLEEELAAAYADAFAISQEQEAYVEELQSANEEVISSNEELQTLNEELETSKEEIESANEELISTNQELQTRNDLLNESYEYSEAIISTMSDSMLVLDKDLRIKSANRSFYQTFHVKEQDTEGALLYELGNKQWDIPRLRELLGNVISKNSQFFNYEVTHVFHNIGERIMSLNASSIVQKTHREQLILLVIADITELRHLILEKELKEKELLNKEIKERKEQGARLEKAVEERTRELVETNEKLKRSEERYHRMINEVEDYAILYLTREGNIENWNEGAEKIKGYKAEDILGKHFRVFYTEADRKNKLPEELLKEAIKNNKANHEGWRVRKDGSLFWGHVLITALHDDKNNVIGFSKVTRDLTEKKRSDDLIKETNELLSAKNQALEDSQNRIKTIIEVAPDAVITIDHNGIILNWNKEAEKIFGWMKSEVVGKTLASTIIPERYRERHTNGLKKFLESGRGTVLNKPIEIEALTKGKKEIPVELKISASVVNKKAPIFIGFVRDISRRRQNEEALRLNTDQLIEANEKLQKMNKELEAFTYVSSHDLQEPLRKIQTFAGRILEKESQNLSNSGKDYFHRVQEASLRMQTLIQDLLAFSRLSAGERTFETTDLGNIIEHAIADLREVIDEKHAIVEVRELCSVSIVPFQFRQLMLNLLSNALKFSRPGTPPHVTIKSGNITSDEVNEPKLTPGKKYCHITVSDNGIGFEKEFSEKIFEVFQRLHRKDQYPGTGIGLAIVKKIVENHGGVITAASELNKGTTFNIYIPAN